MSKLNPNRVAMPEQAPEVRVQNFDEVALGYTLEQALEEASRCILCPARQCVKGCPVNVPIPEFIGVLVKGSKDPSEAAAVIKEINTLPAICGRVCPQENQCEKLCVVGKRGTPVAIGRLERFVADWAIVRGGGKIERAAPTGRKVAVVGAGPAGLTAAGDLARLGHEVDVLEALHMPGGVLAYGIPAFRLPRSIIDTEIGQLREMGVNILTDYVVGRTLSVDELLAEYDAVFLGTGAGLPQFMGVPGENLNGVLSANEFLTRVNLMHGYEFPKYDTPIRIGKQVAVIGAGNVAMDAARCAKRLGVEHVMIVYRRSEKEVPARLEEFHHAKEEGIDFRFLTAPTRVLGDEQGWVTGLECQRMELGEPDASGRRRPVPVPGSEHVVECGTVVVAIGTSPNPLVLRATDGLQLARHGNVIADEAGKTTKARVWAGGDAVTGAATVIEAMGAGKRAGEDIHAYLCSLSPVTSGNGAH